jgi:hypothetical protein
MRLIAENAIRPALMMIYASSREENVRAERKENFVSCEKLNRLDFVNLNRGP